MACLNGKANPAKCRGLDDAERSIYQQLELPLETAGRMARKEIGNHLVLVSAGGIMACKVVPGANGGD